MPSCLRYRCRAEKTRFAQNFCLGFSFSPGRGVPKLAFRNRKQSLRPRQPGSVTRPCLTNTSLASRLAGSPSHAGCGEKRRLGTEPSSRVAHTLHLSITQKCYYEAQPNLAYAGFPKARVSSVFCSSSWAFAEPVAGVELAARLTLRSLEPTIRLKRGTTNESAPMLAGSSCTQMNSRAFV